MIANLVQFVAQAVGLGVMLALSLFAGAVLGNQCAGRPFIGAALGAGCFLAAAIYRWRDHPNRAQLYFAALLDESPFQSVPLLTLAAFAFMAGMAALGGVAGHTLGNGVSALHNTDANQTTIAAMIGAALAVAFMLRSAMTDNFVSAEPDHRNAFGDAHVSALAEMQKVGISTDYRGGIWLGVWRELVATGKHWWQFRRPAHEWKTYWLTYRGDNSALMIAPPGSGKFTCSEACTLLLNEEDSIVVFDPKRQAYAVTASQRRRFGQEVVEFNPLGVLPDLPGESAQINPLGELDLDSPMFEPDCKTLANKLVPIDPEEKNKFFPRSAQGLTLGVMMFTRETEGECANLPRVAQLLHASPAERNAMYEAMTKSRFAFVQGVGNRYWLRPGLKLLDSAEEVTSTAQSELDWLLIGANYTHPKRSTGMARLFGYGATGPVFSWRQLKSKQRRTTVYLVLPVKAIESFAKMTKLLIGGAVDTLIEGPVAPVVLLCDEMPNAFGKDAKLSIQQAANVGRFVGLRVQGIAQTWPQLVDMYSENGANGLRGAVGLLQFFGSNDSATAAIIRQEMGDKTIWSPTTSPIAEFGIEGSIGAVGVPLLTDQQLKDMHQQGGQISFLLGSGGAVVMPRFPHYFEVPELLARADPDPYHS